ncbi:hypothetical protein FMEXI_2985 [Fusarium mexicanum]|uniref:Uncharacterized protein n=1 Tax=Fusarium mexicanum TaxID=751941 RepID=A0A8H5JCK2_9HYPO|nr:hypothetical protein FMEXI_2985 [Fusarium mexicanum]
MILNGDPSWQIHFTQDMASLVLELPKLLSLFNLLQHPNLKAIFIESLISLIPPRLTRHAYLVLLFIDLETRLAVAFCLVTFPEFSFFSEFVQYSRHFCFFAS